MENHRVIANIPRLHSLMDQAGLAGVVLRSGENVTYLSGVAYPGTLARHLDLAGSKRAVLLIWPREGEPLLIVDRIAAGVTERDSWLDHLRVFDGYKESAYEALCGALAEIGLAQSKIGFDKNFIGAGYWEQIIRRLPQLDAIDCTSLMDEVRWVKTDAEVELLRSAAKILDDVYLEVFPTIRAGEPERDVHSRIVASCIRKGAGWAHGILNSSRNPVIYCGEGDFAFKRGDIVRTDYVSYFKGYPGHQNRNAVIGKPSATQNSDYSLYRDVYQKTLEKCNAGITAGELYAFTYKEFERRGWEYKPSLIGHSVGPWWHQQEPIITRDSPMVIEEGMVLAIEPFVDHWHVQDLVYVREKGIEVLSDGFPTEKLFVIS
jgi:Xaa-Pro aminopeptidase